MELERLLGKARLPSNIPTRDEKITGVLSHLLTFISWLIGPFIIYLLRKNDSIFVATHAKESMNFQITLSICYFVCRVLKIIFIGDILMSIIGVISAVLIIIASLRAYEGKNYTYPFNIRFIK